MNRDLRKPALQPITTVLSEIRQLEQITDRMFDAVVDCNDSRLDALSGEVDKAIRKLKERAEQLK